MNDMGEGPWPHFYFDDHVTNLRQDDPRVLPGQSEFRAFALPPPEIEEPKLHPQGVLTCLAPLVGPALHFHTRLMELAAGEGMDPFHAFLQMMCVALPWGLLGRSGVGPHSKSAGARSSHPYMSSAGLQVVAPC